MNYRRKLKVSISPAVVALFLAGFGLGYGVKELSVSQEDIPSHQPLPSGFDNHSVSVCFTPGKQCQAQLVDIINKAKTSIAVQAYSFTDQDIAQALVRAYKRGVAVKAILDKSNVKDSRSAKNILMENGIPVRFDYPSGIAHNKVMVIDGTVVTGSYNFSAAAYKRNAENLLVIHSTVLAGRYMENWLKRWDLSR